MHKRGRNENGIPLKISEYYPLKLFQDPQSKLVLKVPVQKREDESGVNISNSINMNDSSEYGYEQLPAPKF